MTEKELGQHLRTDFELEKLTKAGMRGAEDVPVYAASPVKLSGDMSEERTVDLVLSDMSEPWAQTHGFWKRSLSDPYYRMMNASGMSFRDHAGSMVT